jgi:ribosome biogenesis GTPase
MRNDQHTPCEESFTCRACGALGSNRVAADDNPVLLLSIAVKPLAMPPFPLGRLDNMAKGDISC